MWVLFLYTFIHLYLCLLVQAFNSFTFKIVIYVCSYCHFVNSFGFAFEGHFFPLLFSCDLMTMFHVWIPFSFLYILITELICSYLEVLIKQSRYTHNCFKLLIS